MPTRRRRQVREHDSSEKDFMTRLADAGEEALQRLSELPGRPEGPHRGQRPSHARRRPREEGARDRRARGAGREAREGARGAEEGEDGREPLDAAGKPAGLARLAGTRSRSASRHDLEARRRRARLLAVDLDRERLVRVDGDDAPAQELEPRVREVLARGTSSGARRARSRFVTSPMRRTSKRPSSGSASGHIIMPPPR